ncbi:MAG TPA: hypothetical protein VHX61_14610 [Rhizomicrobium sp.]|nr:hypothetical protein [Rhizomicrobium sp.]
MRAHLRKYRPKQVAAAKADGSLNDQVSSLSESIANWVNSQLPDEKEQAAMDPATRQAQMNSALRFAESDAQRELLPRDEAADVLIGPNGGYVDRIVETSGEDDYRPGQS